MIIQLCVTLASAHIRLLSSSFALGSPFVPPFSLGYVNVSLLPKTNLQY